MSHPMRSLVLLPLVVSASGCAGPGAAGRALSIRLVGGPTAILELGGVRLLTDPTFSAPGDYPAAPGRVLTKLEGPAVAVDALGPIDAVLLSHDQHVDNLDPAGRAVVARAPLTLSTPEAARRLGGGVVGLRPWESATVRGRDGRTVRVTAVPAQHGPDDTEHLTGPVTGFLVDGEGLPTVYVSGDNASVEVVRAIAARARVDVALLFAGAARSPRLLGDALLTLDGARAVDVARLLDGAAIVPLHFRGWRHFTESADALRAAFAAAGLSDRLSLLEPGASLTLPKTRRP